jgi:hypothetical protein
VSEGGETDAMFEDAQTPDDASTPIEDAGPDATVPDASTRVPRQDLDLLGASCARLMSGKVRQVQVVFGCPTVTPK